MSTKRSRNIRRLVKIPDYHPDFQIGDFKSLVRASPHCFICDSLVCGKGTSLLMGSAPYSKTGLPTKIGQLMGDRFMVIVTTDDVLCRRCSSLIIRLDKLEFDTEVVKKALTGYLKMKYHLYEEELVDYSVADEMCIESPINEDDQIYQALKGVEFTNSEDEECVSNAYIKNELKVEEPVQNLAEEDVTGYKCVACQYKTTSSSVFVEHLKIHSSEMYFKCSNCDKEFHNHLDIQEHIMNVHYSQTSDFQMDKGTENPLSKPPLTFYECNICKFQSQDRKVFDNHVLKHNKTSTYECSFCSEKFKLKTLLNEHMKSHQALECELCNVTFAEKNAFMDHFVHHQILEICISDKEQIVTDTNENVEKSVEIAKDSEKCDNAVPTCSSDKKDMYDGVEELLEQLHSESTVPGTEVTEVSVNEYQNTAEQVDDLQVPQVGSEVKNQNIKEEVKNDKEIAKEPMEYQENSLQLENSEFYKDDDEDDLSPDIDRNEDSETNDYINDASEYLEEAESNSEPEDEPQESVLGDSVLEGGGFRLKETSEILADTEVEADCDEEGKGTGCLPVVYVCSICGLRAHTESHMKRHFKSHIAVEKKIYECHICNKVLTTRSNLNRHLSNHENCPGVVTCKLCNEELTDRLHLKQHLEDQHTGPQHCSFCDMEFTSKKAFKEHELTHPERAIHQCTICHKRFLTQLRLKTHLENLHNDTKATETGEKVYKCHICSKVLATYHNLKRHVRNHEKSSGSVKCSLCSEELTDKLHLRQHVEEVHPETHQCSFCQKVFTNKKVCKTHELTHPERYVYKCDVCEKMFLNETRLEKHKTMFHRDPHCRYCEKEIKDPTKLFNHERRHEMYKNKFPCQLCPKVFRTPSGLKYHSSVHTGKYAVYCEICGKGMHSEIVLEEHKATHTKEIRYTCELCGRNFSSNSTYRMHRKWHDDPLPYKCKICDRKFKHTSILAVHMRRAHTGERPYKCPHCPYTFSVSSTLHKHIILHTKKYPHNCKLCGKGFTTRTKIARHMARVHNDLEMINAKPTPCQYKMVLKPSELPADSEESTSKEGVPQTELLEPKFEEAVEEQIEEAGQAIFLFH